MTPPLDEATRRLAGLLKALPVEQDRDPYPGATLLGHVFRLKLVAPPLHDAHLHIAPGDHLKALAVLDFFARVLVGDWKVLDNLRYILDQARARNPRPLLTLPLLLVECGLLLQELGPDAPADADVRDRAAESSRDLRPPRPADPFFLAL